MGINLSDMRNCFIELWGRISQKSNIVNTSRHTINDDQYTLTPEIIPEKIDEKENPAYNPVKDIGIKLENKDVKNIALTGPYGSGKSSVLLTLQKDYAHYNYLNISLATLECNKENDETKKSRGDITENENSLNRLIEYSILQQIIYREETGKTPQSRLKRIKHISDRQSWSIAMAVALCVIALSILFEPSFLRNESLYATFSASSTWKIFWDIISFVYLMTAGVYMLKWIVVNIYNRNLNKINLKDGEIEIKEDTSIFNKYLEEIIYFFQVTKYNVVIIEDLDRFNTNTIYIKIRELNNLLNNSKSICGKGKAREKIVFIYAVRDDMFHDTSRTKFFDYITTVIPVINPSNSCDKLISALHKHGITNIDDNKCKDLGFFINDMRIMKNIVNEFLQYQSKLDKKLDPAKLLAMIIYKNYYPKDFSLLHNQDGLVYKIISNKIKYHNSVVEERDKKIKDINNDINELIKYQSSETDIALRSRYILKYIELCNNNLIAFIQQGTNKSYSPQQIATDAKLFDLLTKDSFTNYTYKDYYDRNSNRTLTVKFKDVENQIGSKYDYLQRTSLAQLTIAEKRSEIERIQQEILNYRALPLHEILSQYPAYDFLEDVKGNHLIAFLLRQGYIDESYYDYISYFYEGTITVSDRDYLLDLRAGISKEYDYAIQKVPSVVEQIQDYSFKSGLIKNHDIINYITDNKQDFKKQYQWIITSLKAKKDFDFLASYYKSNCYRTKFFDDLLVAWSTFFETGVIKANTKEQQSLNYEIYLNFFNKEKLPKPSDKQLRQYISNSFDIINDKLNNSQIHIDRVEILVDILSIYFTTITVKKANSALMQFILDKSRYTLTLDNVVTILTHFNIASDSKYKLSSYTTILDSNNNNLIEYVNEDINHCIEHVFAQESTQETEQAILELLQNPDIEEDVKKSYLLKQVNKIEDISIVEESFWQSAMEYNLVRATWSNIETYIEQKKDQDPISQTIITFIDNNASKLCNLKTKDQIDDKLDSKLFCALLGTNALSIESYKLIRNSFNRCFTTYELSHLEQNRYRYLIESNTVKLNETQHSTASAKFPALIPQLILKNKSIYLKTPSAFPLPKDSVGILLEDPGLSTSEKYTVIENASDEAIKNSALLVCNILLQIKLSTNDIRVVLTAIPSCPVTDVKLKLVLKMWQAINYDEQFVKSCLTGLGEDYAIIGQQKGHRPKLLMSDDNIQLAKYLEQNKFISKHTEEKGMLRINCKNVTN